MIENDIRKREKEAERNDVGREKGGEGAMEGREKDIQVRGNRKKNR